jgi:hypothetical protein
MLNVSKGTTQRCVGCFGLGNQLSAAFDQAS